VEKFFGLGKTDTLRCFARVSPNGARQIFCVCARFKSNCKLRENIDFIRVSGESRNSRRAPAGARAMFKKLPVPHTRIVEKQGAFWGCVHRPLIGVGVFFVALV
jgi:hypothetical protein